MESSEAWRYIVNELIKQPREFNTVPRINRRSLWFTARIVNDRVEVYNSSDNQPSCNMTEPREIAYKDFAKVFSYYSRWDSGEPGVRDEVRRVSRNTAYIFALIKHILTRH